MKRSPKLSHSLLTLGKEGRRDLSRVLVWTYLILIASDRYSTSNRERKLCVKYLGHLRHISGMFGYGAPTMSLAGGPPLSDQVFLPSPSMLALSSSQLSLQVATSTSVGYTVLQTLTVLHPHPPTSGLCLSCFRARSIPSSICPGPGPMITHWVDDWRKPTWPLQVQGGQVHCWR